MDQHKINHVGVAGAGAWGTALAQAIAQAGHDVTLWAHSIPVVEEINAQRSNRRFLPDVVLSPRIRAVPGADDLCGCDALLLSVPAQSLRRILSGVPLPRVPMAICAKGIERASGLMMHEVARTAMPGGVFGLLSGPSFAVEVARGLPCAVTVAFEDPALAAALCASLGSSSLRPYASSDVAGVAVGGAVKNVMAIACGIVEGRGLGESARAAVMTRGFAEMARFGQALGGQLETMTGLSGFGDLVLTASSRQSRNFSLGVQLAQGLAIVAPAPLAEGAATAPALVQRARSLGIQMPIAESVASIVAGEIDVDSAIRALLSRPLKREH